MALLWSLSLPEFESLGQKFQSNGKPSFLLYTALIVMFSLGGCVDRDITNKPVFSQLAGRCFILQQDLYLCDANDSYANYYISYDSLYNGGPGTPKPVGPEIPKSVDDYKANQAKFRKLGLVGGLPAGVRIRIEKFYDTLMNDETATARILDGEFKGKTVEVAALFTGTAYAFVMGIPNTPPLDYWHVDARYLRSCDDDGNGAMTQPDRQQ